MPEWQGPLTEESDSPMRSPPALDIRQLYYFATLAEHGSISAAAAVLDLAQPTLSENLNRLERKLETQLVKRSGRGVQLTEAGKVLVRHCHSIVRAANSAIDEIHHVSSELRGSTSIGLPPTLGLLLTVPLAETVQAEMPDIRLRIVEAMSADILDWVSSERVDLGCVFDPPDSQTMDFEPILEEKLFLLAAPDNLPETVVYDETGNAFIRGGDLQSLPLALTCVSRGARKVIDGFARAAGIHLNVVLEMDSLPPLITMTTRASAYTIMPHAAVINEVAQGSLSLIEIIEPTMTRTAYLVRKRSRPITRSSAAVEETVRTVLAEMVERFQLEAVVPARLK